MTEKYFYLDTSIWLDFYGKRGDNGKRAYSLFQRILKEKDTIYYSDFIILELKRIGYDYMKIKHLFSSIRPIQLQRLHISSLQLKEARKLMRQRKVPKGDALHAILARDNNAFLISRDNDFKKIKDISQVYLPEEII